MRIGRDGLMALCCARDCVCAGARFCAASPEGRSGAYEAAGSEAYARARARRKLVWFAEGRRQRSSFRLHIGTTEYGVAVATIDSLDQGVYGIEAGSLKESGSTFQFDIPSVNATFEGTVAANRESIEGTGRRVARICRWCFAGSRVSRWRKARRRDFDRGRHVAGRDRSERDALSAATSHFT